MICGLLLLGASQAYAEVGCVPNPNLNGIDSCPPPASALNQGGPAGWIDAIKYGVTCDSTDSTAAMQAALNAANSAKGGIVSFNCPITVAGTVTIPSNVRLFGVGSSYYQGQNSGINLWPPATSPAINCTNTSAPCIIVNGQGIEIDHINFGNPQPAPPTSGTWAPTVYPFVIATTGTSGWQGLYLHDLTFTSTSNAIDLEGTQDYAAYSGSQIKIKDIWCNACLNTGIRFHRIDNPLLVDHVEFTPSWNFSVASMGAYQRANLIGFDMSYVAAPQFSNINFFSTKSAIQVTNSTVTNNFGTLTFATSAAQFSNVMFNQVCQAMTMPGGNGTIAEFYMTNVHVWGDQSGFACAAGKPIFSVPSNDVRLNLAQVGVAYIDSFIAAGCGTRCTPGGGAIIRLQGIDVFEYSHFSANQPFMSAPSGSFVSISGQDLPSIRPSAKAGPIIAPGPDRTRASMASSNSAAGRTR